MGKKGLLLNIFFIFRYCSFLSTFFPFVLISSSPSSQTFSVPIDECTRVQDETFFSFSLPSHSEQIHHSQKGKIATKNLFF